MVWCQSKGWRNNCHFSLVGAPFQGRLQISAILSVSNSVPAQPILKLHWPSEIAHSTPLLLPETLPHPNHWLPMVACCRAAGPPLHLSWRMHLWTGNSHQLTWEETFSGGPLAPV